MTCSNTATATSLIPQFDRILGRIEAGDWQRAVAHLAGLFDAALINCGEPALIRAVLANHPLSDALRQPRLAAETQLLAPDGALAARAALVRGWRDTAQQRGDCWIDLDQDHWPAAGTRHDLILAAALADRLDASTLAAAIAGLAGCLAPRGRLVLSAFVPGHLGCGWQTIWLNRQDHRHEGDAIAAAGVAAGLTARQFHDAGGNLVWAELCRPSSATGEPDA